MKIAYLILAHSDPIELRYLCDRLVRNADVYVHINKKVNISQFEQEIGKINCDNKIELIDHREKVNWGGFSIVKATMNLLERALSFKYDRLILLTGADYPIKTDEYIYQYFENNCQTNFISAQKLDRSSHNLCGYKHYRDCLPISKICSFLIKYFPKCKFIQRKDYYLQDDKKYNLWGISPKWALTQDCASYVLNFYKENDKFNRYFEFSHAPDDFYFATVIMNSPYKITVDNSVDLFYTEWLPENKGAKTLTIVDYDKLEKQDCLFAKKFFSTDSEELINRLESLNCTIEDNIKHEATINHSISNTDTRRITGDR